MSEEQAVYDAVPDAVRVEDVVLTLAGEVADLRRRISDVDHRVAMLQDANLPHMLESSAMLVELRRMADAAERQVAVLETLGTAVEPRHKPSDTPAHIRHRGVS